MSSEEKARSRKRKPFPVKAAAAGTVVLAAAVGMGAGYYINRGKQYETVFFPATVINGLDASDMTVDQVEEMISSQIDDYVLTLVKRGGETEQITKDEIGLHSVFDGTLERHLAGQDPMDWWRQQKQTREFSVETMIDWDEEKLREKLDSLDMFDEELIRQPGDAYLSEYIPGEGYKVLPGEPGTALDREKVETAIRKAVEGLETELVLEDLGAYVESPVTVEDRELNEMADRLNRYVTMAVTYEFGDQKEVLDGDIIVDWISEGTDGQVFVDQEQVTAYVKRLAAQYDTIYKPKKLLTSYGQTVEITKGFYGWRMDQEEEAKALYEILMSGESQTREPVYRQRGASHGETDYGDTYVEINLTAQHLYFYKDGQLVIESDFVSGNQARGDSTPSGAYPLTYKQRNAVLKGATYRTPVSYWMPFNGNIGMHDAGWRGSFGGNIYKTNGSHGCINLPPAAARTIFENIETGVPVLCYHLDGAEETPSGSGSRAPAGREKPKNQGIGAETVETGEAPAESQQESSAAAGGQETDPAAGQGYVTPAGQEGGTSEESRAAADEDSSRGPGGDQGHGPKETQAGDSRETVEAQTPESEGENREEAGGQEPGPAGNQESTEEIGPGVGNGSRGESQEIGPGVGI